MAHTSYRASAPGTLMLLGEHAVLHDKQAIVLSIDKRMTVLLTPRPDTQVVIDSTLGKLELDLESFDVFEGGRTAENRAMGGLQKPFEFVLAAILHLKEQIPSGFNLSITSEFSPTIGLGSSAAVTVATIAVLYQFIDLSMTLDTDYGRNQGTDYDTNRDMHPVNKLKIFEDAKKVIKAVQGVGSGADAAASVFGGIILYRQRPPYILKKINALLPIVVIYSGSKTPTPIVVGRVQKSAAKYPDIFDAFYSAMDHCAAQGMIEIETNHWQSLGEIINIQQGIMNALGVSTPHLNRLLDTLNNESTIFGAKISGSGLGDCIIGIGESHQPSEAKSGLQGVCYG